MNDIAISLTNVSKCFKRYDRPTDRLKEIFQPKKTRGNEFWAVRDVSLEVSTGQTLGIVGRNGSGKSTLLQIIVGTLTPTSGRVSVKGRISALLELGSGFNPEFTGRQNVFFNGQLLGLKQQEIEAKFDSIAAFADIGDFIDQPVKTYSSGMFVRLAFAVATSVEPNVLVVDEALSVGDEAFQRKCFARIESIKSRGGTILFVSHSAAAIVELCDRAVLLDGGEMLLAAKPKVVVDRYHKLIYAPADRYAAIREEIRNSTQPDVPTLRELNRKNGRSQNGCGADIFDGSLLEEDIPTGEFYDPGLVPNNTLSYTSRGAKVEDPQVLTLEGEKVNNLIGRRDYIYTYRVTFAKAAEKVRFGMLLKTISGLELGGISCPGESQSIDSVEVGTTVTVKFRFKCILNPGVYFLNAGVSGIVDGTFTYLARYIDVAMFRVGPNVGSMASCTIDFLIEPSLCVDPELANVEP
ncbi:MAG: ABC transporter ATP-binding protein [Cyanobacteriota bacterium]|nr:ABC transporter ATP-binding protein [Cyanobacteriota bacterium]